MGETNRILENEIDSDYVPTGEILGCGCWGKVSVYKKGSQEWAVKTFSPNETAIRQMAERGWMEEDVMRREEIPIGAASHNVVPRLIERDRRGKPFVAMPVYREGDLSSRIKYLSFEESLNIAKDLATALKYIHSQKKIDLNGMYNTDFSNSRAHGDVKPSNILVEKGRAYLGDLGSSTCISIGGSGEERGPHGDINYRAPECFNEDGKPSARADVWSFGAILYEAVTKEGIYEKVDMNKIGTPEFNKAIKKKIGNVPRGLRPFLRKCLAVDSWDRFYDGGETLNELEKTIGNIKEGNAIWKTARKWTVPLGVASVITGAFIYNAVVAPEPQRLGMPSVNFVQGMLEKPGKAEEPIEFEKENFELPKARELGMLAGGYTQYAKRSTDNRVVAYLAKTLAQASTCYSHWGDYTPEQQKIYMQYTTGDERQMATARCGPVWPIWAKSIEVALSKSKTENSKVDLEDVMAITVAGEEKVLMAKRAAKSFDYAVYRNAKDSEGKPIIQKKEQRLIEGWRAYYEADIDI